ncbi:MAG: hypothetical protein U0169_25750 [Polyangiaceae bacterium]
MTAPPLESRFVALVRRELGADDVRLADAGDVVVASSNTISARLPDGRTVIAVFGSEPESREVLGRRLEILVQSFDGTIEVGERPSQRAHRMPVHRTLHTELRALAKRAAAVDAVVIDAHSPVVWGSASDAAPNGGDFDDQVRAAMAALSIERSEFLDLIAHELETPGNVASPPPEASGTSLVDGATATEGVVAESDGAVLASEPPASIPPPTIPPPPGFTERALDHVRKLPTLASLKRGSTLHERADLGELSYVVRSFAGIYLLVVVYAGSVDELRAERAVREALPRIERLVLALPPLEPDPAPSAGAIAFRRPRRR